MKRKVGSSKSTVMLVADLLDSWIHDVQKRIEKSTYDQYQHQANKLNVLLGDLQLYTLDATGIAERLM